MDKLTELRQRMEAKAREAKPLAEKYHAGTLTDAESRQFDTIANELRGIQEEIATETRRRETASLVGVGSGETETRASGVVAIEEVRRRVEAVRANGGNIGRAFAASPMLRDYNARGANGVSDRFGFGTTRPELIDALGESAVNAEGKLEERALVYTGGWANYLQANRLQGNNRGVFDVRYEQPRTRDVFANGRTDSPSIEYVRKNASTNNAAEVAEPATVAGAVTKPESAMALEVVTTTVKTIAHGMPVTRQMLQDAGQIEAFINADLLRGLAEREDRQLLLGDGTGATLTGLFATSGIKLHDGAYWAGAGAALLPTDDNELDRILVSATQIMLSGGTPNFVIAHPNDVARWRMLKDANGNYLLRGGGPDNAGVPTVWGIPVVYNIGLTAGQAAVGDGRYAIVLDKLDGQIYQTDSHSDWFYKNLIAILAESRLAFAVTQPSVFARVYLTA